MPAGFGAAGASLGADAGLALPGSIGRATRVYASFGRLPMRSAAWLLQGLMLVDLDELAQGAKPILPALVPGSGPEGGRAVRYIRRDPLDDWQTIRGLWAVGGGDCKSLAAAGAAELYYVLGIPARPVVYPVRPGLAHAVIQRLDTGQLLDPSRLGGMGEGPDGAIASWYGVDAGESVLDVLGPYVEPDAPPDDWTWQP
jgi:hypothetical protein